MCTRIHKLAFSDICGVPSPSCSEESPDVRAFSFHPGSVKTEVALLAIKDTPNEAAYEAYMIDTPQLPACTMLYLSSGGADFLAGR